MQTRRHVRALVLTMTALLPLGAGAVSTSAASPAGNDPSVSAWAVIRDASATSGIPGADDQGHSAGGEVQWVKITPGGGWYGVNLYGLSPDSGVPHVSAISTEPRTCLVEGWGGEALQVIVRCVNQAGVPTDTPFSLVYMRGVGPSGGRQGRLAHAWVNNDFPRNYYNHVSEGGAIERVLNSVGDHTLTIPGLGDPAGTGAVLLTANRMLDLGGIPATCATVASGPDGSDLIVHVRCRDLAGNPADGIFSVTFLRKLGPEGFGGGPAAYLRASRKDATAPYQPESAYAWQSNGRASSITRTALGVYRVTLREMPGGGAAIVTAFGATKARCQLGSISTGAPARITVRCYKPNGAPVNSNFTLAWTK